MSEVLFCSTCGYPVPKGVTYCIRCGHPIDKVRPSRMFVDPGAPPVGDNKKGASLPDNNRKEDLQEKKGSGIMANFFKKLFGKKKTETPSRVLSIPQGNELDRYALAFMLVPLLVESYNESLRAGGFSEGNESIFWNIAFWKHIAGKMDYTRTDFDWNEISFFKQQIGQKKYVAIIFPAPFKAPQAKYGLVVIDKEASYYTLEKTLSPSSFNGLSDDGQDNYWVLGGVTARHHLNFGTIKGDLTVSQFIEEVKKKL